MRRSEISGSLLQSQANRKRNDLKLSGCSKKTRRCIKKTELRLRFEGWRKEAWHSISRNILELEMLNRPNSWVHFSIPSYHGGWPAHFWPNQVFAPGGPIIEAARSGQRIRRKPCGISTWHRELRMTVRACDARSEQCLYVIGGEAGKKAKFEASESGRG